MFPGEGLIRARPPTHFTLDHDTSDNPVGSRRIVFLSLIATAVAYSCCRKLWGRNHFGFCAPGVPWKDGARRARYLRNPRNPISAHPRLE